MFIKIENIKYHVKIMGTGTPIFALHGFAQNLGVWDFLEDFWTYPFQNALCEKQNRETFLFDREQCARILQNFSLVTIDLMGHGQSDAPYDLEYYQLDTIIRHLHILIHKIQEELALFIEVSRVEREGLPYFNACSGEYFCTSLSSPPYILLGYSLGGRIALCYALKYQAEMQGLILESSAYGMENREEREKRKEADFKLADTILSDNLDHGAKQALHNFHAYWSSLPIFATQKKLPQDVLAKIKKNRLQNLPHALANTLKATGQGTLASLKNQIPKLYLPTLYISGELDIKYTKIGQELAVLNDNFQHAVLENLGHNTHLESPSLFVQVLAKFLEKNHYCSGKYLL